MVSEEAEAEVGVGVGVDINGRVPVEMGSVLKI